MFLYTIVFIHLKKVVDAWSKLIFIIIFWGGVNMEVIIREIEVNDYPEVVSLWINVLGNRKVNLDNFP